MSANKFKYFDVNLSFTVRANSKADAQKLVYGEEDVPGEVLEAGITVVRVSAQEAQKSLSA